MNAIDDGPIAVIPNGGGSERIPNLLPNDVDVTAAILAAVDALPCPTRMEDDDDGDARDECPNHHSASGGQCSVSWCPYSR